MSSQEFTAFVQEMRAAIREIKEDVRRIENDLIESKRHKPVRKWYNWWS